MLLVLKCVYHLLYTSPRQSWKCFLTTGLSFCRFTISSGSGEASVIYYHGPKVQWAELAGARGHTGGAAHGIRRQVGAFGPRKIAPNLLLEVGDGPHDGRYFQNCCWSVSSRGWCGASLLHWFNNEEAQGCNSDVLLWFWKCSLHWSLREHSWTSTREVAYHDRRFRWRKNCNILAK